MDSGKFHLSGVNSIMERTRDFNSKSMMNDSGNFGESTFRSHLSQPRRKVSTGSASTFFDRQLKWKLKLDIDAAKKKRAEEEKEIKELEDHKSRQRQISQLKKKKIEKIYNQNTKIDGRKIDMNAYEKHNFIQR